MTKSGGVVDGVCSLGEYFQFIYQSYVCKDMAKENVCMCLCVRACVCVNGWWRGIKNYSSMNIPFGAIKCDGELSLW